MRSKEDIFSEFYYTDEIVTENEGNVEVYGPRIEARSIKQKCHLSVWNFTVKPSRAVIK